MHRENVHQSAERDDDVVADEASADRCVHEHSGVQCVLPRGHRGRHIWRGEHSEINWQ